MRYTERARTAVSVARAAAVACVLFLTDVYCIGLGIGMPASELTCLTLTDNWFDVRGTQTTPPPVKPAFYAAFALAIAADLVAIFDVRPGSVPRILARAADAAAAITVAVVGELLLAHVETNKSDDVNAGQSATLGACVPTLMLLLLLPLTIESVAVIYLLVPTGP